MILDELTVRLGVRGAEDAVRRVSRVSAAVGALGRAGTAAGFRLGGAFAKLGGSALSAAGPITSLLSVAGLAGMTVMASKTAADMESLELGLTAVAGSAEEARRQMARLKEIARLPGLGFQEAIQGATAMQAAGMSAQMAERALMAFGNALATVGKGRAELDGVITALTQIMSKGVVSAEEILQIAERVPQIRRVMMEAFGTASTEAIQEMGITSAEFIERVTAALEKLPRASGGTKGLFENLGDTIMTAFAAAGESINRALVPALQDMDKWLTRMVQQGAFARLGEQISRILKPALKWVMDTIEDLSEDNGIIKFLRRTLPVIIDWASIFIGALAVINALLGNTAGAVVGLLAVIGLQFAKFAAIRKLDELLRQPGMEKIPSPEAPEAPGAPGGEGAGLNPFMRDRTGQEIARNTREMADAFRDLRVEMFGGGRRAAAAASSTEVELALARALGLGIG